MNKLDEICAAKRREIAQRKAQMPEAELLQVIEIAGPPRGFKRALEHKIHRGKPALIAEIKKASPSGGLIRAEFDPAALAQSYEDGGAACLSVLTDTPYFEGDNHHLAQARESVALPVLRKDFMLDPYQIIESRAVGADCILLIMAALSDAQAQELHALAKDFGMDALVEVHDRGELDRALKLAPQMIGINNRDLKTLKTDLAVSESLAKHVPGNILCVSESGIRTHADIQRMQKAGIHCFLVGESLLRQADVTKATQELLGTL